MRGDHARGSMTRMTVGVDRRIARRGWIALPLLALMLYVGARRIGPAPALGSFIDPAHGMWAIARAARMPARARATVPGLLDSVQIIYDDRAVPHIFARSESDVYRALGYVVARDRLFQLEMQTRAAAGTLTEVAGAGPGVLLADRETRRLGLPRAAEQKLAALDTTDPGFQAIMAYADGINAWIDGLDRGAMPAEFHLLGARPARWEPINSIHLLNRMGWTLSYSEEELPRLAARALVGGAAADALFPVDSPIQEPIQPAGLGRPRLAWRKLPPPGRPDTSAAALADLATDLRSAFVRPDTGRRDAIGSNNWAVAPRRTAAGHALLAGDPHLELTLPSIWYEAHLVVPGVLDVYGVTIPGAPSIIIGFNRDVAWTFTNTQADVVDFYLETVDDDASPSRYRLDGAWKPLEMRIEHYRTPDGSIAATDTLRFTHRGPLKRLSGSRLASSSAAGRWVSMRWTVLEPSRETAAFIAGMHARSAGEWLDAMAGYRAPAQNMLVADRSGTIAIRSTGAFPLRPGDGRGNIIRDGSLSASDWTGSWPVSRFPQAVNPAQGFLASANQQPIDPQMQPDYLGTDWFPPWRALRINALLRADSAVTPDAMRRYQTDPGSPRADLFVAAFLQAARAGGGPSPTLDHAARLLGEWDRRYTVDNERAVLFEQAMRELARNTWDELRRDRDGSGPRPGETILAELLNDPTSAWWDLRRTVGVERRDDILRASLAAALDSTRRSRGDPNAGAWRWSLVQRATIAHLAGIAGFGVEPLPIQGGPSTLNPSAGSGRHGASWRMVVEMGPEVRGWGTYPGGQSGNPRSDFYSDRLAAWASGRLDTLRFPRSATELGPTRTLGTLTLEPRR
jgi:penicillin amidase